MAQVLQRLVLLCYLGGIHLSSWMASIASSTTALVFLGSLGLRLISGGGGAIGLSLVFILGGLILGLPVSVLLVFLCRRTMAFGAPGVDFPNIKGWLQVSLYFYITCLLHHFFPRIQVSSLMVQLGSEEQTQSFLEIANQGCLVGGTSKVKLFQYSLQVLQVRGLVRDFLLLVLGVSSDLRLVAVYKGPGVSQGLLEKCLELIPGDQDRAFYFQLPLMLLPVEVDSISQEKGCERNSVQPGGSKGGKIIFTQLTEIIVLHGRPSAVDVRGFGLEFISRSTL